MRTISKPTGLLAKRLKNKPRPKAKRFPVKPHSAISQIVDANQGLVRYTINHFELIPRAKKAGIPMDDLLQYGQWGLWQAAKRFDPRKNVPFSSYAVPSILRAMTQPMKRALRFKRRSNLNVLSLNEPLQNEIGSPAIQDFLISPGPGPSQVVLTKIQRAQMRSLMKQLLTPREFMVVSFGFGLQGKPPRNLRELGEFLGVSRERVRQIEAKALKKLSQSQELRDWFMQLKK